MNRLRLPPENSSAAAARRFVVDELREESANVQEVAALLASELVTNAILHANTVLDIAVGRSPVRVEVSDLSVSMPLLRWFGLEASTGRGLQLIARLASTWGIDERPDGKTVWFELATLRPQEFDATAVTPAMTARSRSGTITTERSPLGVPSPFDLMRFVILGLPLRAALRTSEHYDGLFREFRLIADRERQAHSTVPEGLVELIDDLGTRFSGFTDRQEQEIAAARAEGRDSIDLEYFLPADAVGELARLDGLLDEADAYCEAGQNVLTLPPDEEVLGVRKWILDEFVRQASGGNAVAWVASGWYRPPRAVVPTDQERTT